MNSDTLSCRRFCPWTVLAVAALVFAACSDDVATGPGDCPDDLDWNPIDEECVAPGEVPDQPDAGETDTDGSSGGDDAYEQPDAESCDGLECQQVHCNPGETPTTLTGTVTIPSGLLPLPDVNVYVPNGPIQPIEEGASCVQCGDELSAVPAVETTTDVNGHFELTDAPVGEEIPLIIEVGKWRRQMTVPDVEPCEVTQVDPIKTQLPSNTDEGEMPRIAITTGEWDALECLMPKIGIDKSEITTDDGDGRVHLFAGDGLELGATDRFRDSMHGGDEFTDAYQWWNETENLMDYDILIHSCEGTDFDKSHEAYEAFQEFVDEGGRAFLSHWQHVWLRDGTDDMQSVANWGSTGLLDDSQTGYINALFPKGEMLEEWMYNTGTTPRGEFPIEDARASVNSIHDEYAQEWVSINSSLLGQFTQYFSFNTPVGADEDNQCGRVVFSDIHVSAEDDSSAEHPYPTGCLDDPDNETYDDVDPALTAQEKALVFMLFDLSACVIPDDKKKGDW